jgi:membrane protease YdiL (CAAX protease family)
VNELSRRWFVFGCLFEAALGLIALPVGLGLGADWAALWCAPGGRELAVGVAVSLPLLVLPWAVWHVPWQVFRDVRAVVEGLLVPVLGGWSVGQMLVISLLAGVAEEALFRGALLAGLLPLTGPVAALVGTSVLFGLAHALNRAYALLAAGLGLVLGLEFLATGSLWAPALTHALYDFGALVYLLWRPGRGREMPETLP